MNDSIYTDFKKTKYEIHDPVTDYFIDRIKQVLSDHIKAIILFGSRARQDANEHSDYDFLLIVESKNKELKKKIVNIEADIMDKFEKLVSSLIWEEKDWAVKKLYPIGKNITRDGILL